MDYKSNARPSNFGNAGIGEGIVFVLFALCVPGPFLYRATKIMRSMKGSTRVFGPDSAKHSKMIQSNLGLL